MIAFLSGIGASALHVVSGPDHLAAVTPLAIENRLKAWTVGMFWGIGHTTGALLIGLLFYFFRSLIPVDTISAHSEQVVGIMLIAIGLWALYRVWLARPHDHHYHKVNTIWFALGIGILHGFAGVSHIFSILPTLALPTRLSAGLFLAGYASGTLAVMGLFSYLVGYLSLKTSNVRQAVMFRKFSTTGGLFAVAIGILWIALSF